MAEVTFDAGRFDVRLSTRRLGRRRIALAETSSTNDAAWSALGDGAPDGFAIVADAQTRGRGRSGRVWHTTPEHGLALSLLLREGLERRPVGVLPLAAGLALVESLEALGVAAELKWPNDVLRSGRKLAGILIESRGTQGAAGAVVIGVGVNVSQCEADFPAELCESGSDGARLAPTSLALEGFDLAREDVAAEFLNALEPWWDDLAARGGAPAIEAWSRRASFWGVRVRAHTASGPVEGIARSLDDAGALVIETDGGARVAVVAGDLEIDRAREGSVP